MDGVTRDSFFNGRLRLKQPRHGYRYSIDAVILASAVNPKPGETSWISGPAAASSR